ncbi:hypothetical protein RB195_017982 [Necator americanus]
MPAASSTVRPQAQPLTQLYRASCPFDPTKDDIYGLNKGEVRCFTFKVLWRNSQQGVVGQQTSKPQPKYIKHLKDTSDLWHRVVTLNCLGLSISEKTLVTRCRQAAHAECQISQRMDTDEWMD